MFEVGNVLSSISSFAEVSLQVIGICLLFLFFRFIVCGIAEMILRILEFKLALSIFIVAFSVPYCLT